MHATVEFDTNRNGNTCAMCASKHCWMIESKFSYGNCSVMFYRRPFLIFYLKIHSKGENWVNILLTSAFHSTGFEQSFCAFERQHTMVGRFGFHNWMQWLCLMYRNILSYLNKINRHTQLKSCCVGLGSIFDLCDFYVLVLAVFDRHIIRYVIVCIFNLFFKKLIFCSVIIAEYYEWQIIFKKWNHKY